MRLKTIVILALTALPVAAADPVLLQDFTLGADGWASMTADAIVRAVGDSLVFSYTGRAGVMNLEYLPVVGMPFAEFRSLRFQLRTDVPTPVAVILSEKKPGGGNYSAVAWSAGSQWQDVVLSVSDFTVSDGPADPVDADHKLDPDQVDTVAILDLGQVVSRFGGGNTPIHVEAHDGLHTISIRRFEVSRDPLPPADGGVLDDFSRWLPQWFSPGGASFGQKDGTLTIRYRQLPDEFVAFLRQLPARDYKGATHISMEVASARPAQLIISVNERRADSKPGARYNIDFLVAGGNRTDHRELALDAFRIDENGASDPDGKLDPEMIQSITILDVSGESAENTITLQALRLIRH